VKFWNTGLPTNAWGGAALGHRCLAVAAFDTPGPVLIGVHVDYRESVKLFEQVHEGSTVWFGIVL